MEIVFQNKNSFVGSGVTSNAVGANTKLQFNSIEIDDLSGWDNANKRWICKSAGEYKGIAIVRLNGVSPTIGQYAGAYILVNGVTIKRKNYAYVANSNVSTYFLVVPIQIKLNFNDYLELYADTNLTTPTVGTLSEEVCFEIMKVG